MSQSVSLTVQSAQSDRPGAYRTDITINSSDNSTKYLLVKQRIVNPDGNNDDTFVAVASPAQIEDLPEKAPVVPESFFRDYQVSLIASDPDKLNEVVQHILTDLQLTLKELVELETFTTTNSYTISDTSITIN